MCGRLAFSHTRLHSNAERFIDARRDEYAQEWVKICGLVVSGGVASNVFLRKVWAV